MTRTHHKVVPDDLNAVIHKLRDELRATRPGVNLQWRCWIKGRGVPEVEGPVALIRFIDEEQKHTFVKIQQRHFDTAEVRLRAELGLPLGKSAEELAALKKAAEAAVAAEAAAEPQFDASDDAPIEQ